MKVLLSLGALVIASLCTGEELMFGPTTLKPRPGTLGDENGISTSSDPNPTNAAETTVIMGVFNEFRDLHGARPLVSNATLIAGAAGCTDWLVTVKKIHQDAKDYESEWDCTPSLNHMQYFDFVASDGLSNSEIAQWLAYSWTGEDIGYDLTSPTYLEENRHFSQIIWIKTTQVGCAVSTDVIVGTDSINYKLVVCRFSPAGNIMYGHSSSAFKANVK